MKSTLKKIVIALLLILVLAAGAFYFIYQRNASLAGPDVEIGELYAFPHTFAVDLSDDVTRYVKLQVVFEVAEEEIAEELKQREVQIRDTIIRILRNKTVRELRGSTGHQSLQEEISAAINAMLVKGKLADLYFTELAIQ